MYRERALVEGKVYAKAASFRGATALDGRLAQTGAARTAARHLIHLGCWHGQKHAGMLSERGR
jgi:hypothetical protein